MYGLEWKQPAIVAEALAQACVHGTDLHEFLFTSEKKAAAAKVPMPPIVSLMNAARQEKAFSSLIKIGEYNNIKDGILAQAKDEMLRLTGQVRVQPEELDERTAEMFVTCVYASCSAAAHPTKQPKYDFAMM